MNKLDLYNNLGNELLKNGRIFKKKVFDIKKNNIYKTNSTVIKNIFNNLGMTIENFADRTYYYLDLSTMKDIIKTDWTDKRIYLKETFDCDDFAFAFKSHLSEIYQINGIGLAKHIQVTLSTGEKVFHRAVIFLARDNGLIVPFFLETQNDNLGKIINKNIKLGNWSYKLSSVEF